jgi:hypothetical protein
VKDELDDPWDRPPRTFGDVKSVVIDDVFIERPPRDEDLVRRHGANGRPYIRKIDPATGLVLRAETTYSRVTHAIKCVDANDALVRWGEQRLALGFAARPDEFIADVFLNQENKWGLNSVIKRAKVAGGADVASTLGRALHMLMERYDLGILPAVIPQRYEADLVEWARIIRYFRIIKIEKFMVHDGLKCAGTPDRVVEYLPCPNCGRKFYILDLKTGRVDEYTDLQIAMQLGIYANSDYYDLVTGERTQPHDICPCKAITLHLKAGSGTAVCQWTDIHTGYQIATQVMPLVQDARRQKGLFVPFRPQVNLQWQIESAKTRDEIAEIEARNPGLWGPEHVDAAMRRVLEIK